MPLTALLAPLLCPCCVACGEPAPVATGLCRTCLRSLPALAAPAQAPCAGGERECTGDGVDTAVAAFRYGAPVDALLLRFKFHADLAAGRALAAAALPTLGSAPRPAVLVPVPLHRQRLRERGHDQALLLARDWGVGLGLPVATGWLERRCHTAPQTALDADSRRRNVAAAFEARGTLPAHIALVDDVWTTGSTANAAARALRRAGAARVDVWTVARVPAPGAMRA